MKTGIARTAAWLPLLLLPAVVYWFTPETWPRWAFMWLLAGSLFLGCKWLTWQTAAAWPAPWWRHLGYFFAWPGLDAPAFLAGTSALPSSRAPIRCWLFAVSKLVVGIALIVVVVPWLPR